MHPAVANAFIGFSEEFEGHVQFMYLDIIGLVTCGIGNLIDPVSEALKLPWKRPDGSLATSEQVQQEWQAIKARQDLRKRHFRFAAPVTTVRLHDPDIAALVHSRLRGNVKILRGYFPDWDMFPADAQLGICSMAWAVGAGFPVLFPNFTADAVIQDWLGAREHCAIRSEGNPGVIARNAANRICFANAAAVLAKGLERDVLYWPGQAPEKRIEPPPRSLSPTPFVPDPNITAVHEARDSEIRKLTEDTPVTSPEVPALKKPRDDT